VVPLAFIGEIGVRYKALTIAREYGSGGAEIADIIANVLRWKLIDKALIAEICNKARVPAEESSEMDERVDPWLHRITRSLWGKSADGFSAPVPVELFDAAAAATQARRVIEEAYAIGNCVIVGRGSQCILRGNEDVFHAFVYARREDRARRIQMHEPQVADVAALIHSVDVERFQYVRLNYGEDQANPHLYDLMVNSRNWTDIAAEIILSAMEMTQ
jgi:cytidylate kinase